MPGTVTDLYDLLEQFLDACAEAVLLAPGGAIGRAFVSPGLPAFDCCPQLTVHAGGPVLADTQPLSPPLQPGHRVDETGAVHLVAMTATVIRCVSVASNDEGDPPTPASQDEAAQETLGDLWAIWNHLYTRKRNLTLWGPKQRELFFDPASSLNTSGGCAGWQIPIRVQLSGFRTEVTP